MPSPKPPQAVLTPAQLQAAARALGTGSGGATQLLALLYDPEVAIERVLSSLKAEPALAARVLKVANSPFYRLSGSVGTLDRAVALLGLTAIRGIAAAGCLDRLTPTRSGAAFDPERFRLHSLAVACAAQQLSRAAGAGIEGEAFMAGLLHDIGILLLVKASPAAMAHYAPADTADPADALAHEQAELGATHEACATVLAQAWQLPDWLQQAVACHHTGDAAAAGELPLRGLQALPTILMLANHLAHRTGMGLWPICGMAPPDSAAPALGLDAARLDALALALPDAVAAMTSTSTP
jgi:HD-like signal output (HDOD) protein